MRIDARRWSIQAWPLAQSRLVAVVLLLAALVALYFLLLQWWFVAPLIRVDTQIHALRNIHAKYAAAIAEEPLLRKRVARQERSGATIGAFLSADDPSTAAANLIQRATDVVAAHAGEGSGCSMPSKMPVERGNDGEPFRRVSINISLLCGMRPLAAVLHDFDHGLPYLFVDNLTVARSSAGRLQARLTLSGYLRPQVSR